MKRVCFGKLQTSLCITFYIEVHPPGAYIERKENQATVKTLSGIFGYGKVEMVFTFPPWEHSAKIHLQNSPFACVWTELLTSAK